MNLLSDHFLDTELNVAFAEDRVKQNAIFICTEILEPIRAHYSLPVHIDSGFRNPAHNQAVGGKPNSWHLYDGGHAAADLVVPGIAVTLVFNWIRAVSGLKFDKVILEYDGEFPDVVHVQIDRLVAPRRLAYIGGVGNAHDYVPVEVV